MHIKITDASTHMYLIELLKEEKLELARETLKNDIMALVIFLNNISE